MSGLTQWQPTAQLMWVRRKVADEVYDTVLCQTWIELVATGQGAKPTGNMRLQEIPTIDEPQKSEAANDDPPLRLIV
jgi:hypothetical protein